jgi:Tol biopolymer transport system component
MNAEGHNRKNLTDTPPVNGYEVREGDPAFSPDGTKIAFYKESCRPHDVDLYTITVEGTKLRQVTDLPGKELAPDWSPSGPRLVYRGATRFSERIFTIRADGTGKRLIASDGEGPVFSPDGRRIAFTRNRDLYKVTSGGSGEPARSMVRRSRGSWRPIGDRYPPLLGGSPWCSSEEIRVVGGTIRGPMDATLAAAVYSYRCHVTGVGEYTFLPTEVGWSGYIE